MQALLLKWLNWGVDAEPDYTAKRKIFHTNVGALITALSLAAYCSLFVAIGAADMLRVALASLPLYPLLALVPWLNRRGWDGLARWTLNILAICSTLLGIVLGFGALFHSHYYLIPLALLPVVFFPLRQWPSILFLFIVNLALFLWVEMAGIPVSPGLLALDPAIVQLLRGMYVFTAFLTVLISLGMVEFSAGRSEANLAKMSATDMLTELPNRRFFDAVLIQEMAKVKRTKQPLSLVLLDVDHFKQVNDTYGHDVGDDVLKHIADLMRQSTRADTLVARVGGEEFAMLISNCPPAAAAILTERVREAVEAGNYMCAGEALTLTVSAGIAAVLSENSPEHAYKVADEALYQAKRTGRNRVTLSVA